MSFIGQHLMEGEQIVYRGKLHGIIFVPSVVWSFFALMICLTGNIFLRHFLAQAPKVVTDLFPQELYNILMGGKTGINLLGWIFILLIALPSWIKALVAFISSEFGVSNKRVLIKTGLISRYSFETLLSKIEGIAVQQSLLGRMLDYGTILITGTGGSKEPFTGISQPLEFRKKVQEQIVRHE